MSIAGRLSASFDCISTTAASVVVMAGEDTASSAMLNEIRCPRSSVKPGTGQSARSLSAEEDDDGDTEPQKRYQSGWYRDNDDRVQSVHGGVVHAHRVRPLVLSVWYRTPNNFLWQITLD